MSLEKVVKGAKKPLPLKNLLLMERLESFSEIISKKQKQTLGKFRGKKSS